MNPEQEIKLNEVYGFIQSLKSSQTIPLDFERALRYRIKQPIFASRIIDFGNILSGSSNSEDISVPGALLSDPVVLGIPASAEATGIEYRAYVSALGTVKIRVWNRSGGAIDQAEGLFRVAVLKQ